MQRADALTIFAKVGTLGSISGAARSLQLPKASVSRAVARLEADYGVALLERTTRRVILTDIGVKLHERCKQLLLEYEGLAAEVAAFRSEPSGTLKVSCPVAISVGIGPYISEFLDRYPLIDLRLEVADRVLPEPHGFDIALHVGWLSDSSLIARKIADIPLALVASTDYVARHGLPVTPASLGEHRVVGRYYADPRTSGDRRSSLPATAPPLELRRGEERVLLSRWRRFASNDEMLLLDLVQRGSVIAPIATILVAKQIAAGTVVPVLPDYEITNPPALFAVYASRNVQPPKVRVFVDLVAEAARRILAR